MNYQLIDRVIRPQLLENQRIVLDRMFAMMIIVLNMMQPCTMKRVCSVAVVRAVAVFCMGPKLIATQF